MRQNKILCVAEKPAVAKAVSNILSQHPQVENTASVYNKVYKFTYPFQSKQFVEIDSDHEFSFTSVSGHLKGFKYLDKYKIWNMWDPLVILSKAEIEMYVPEDKINLYNNLKNLAPTCRVLILWLDCDREGENIAFEVLDVCKTYNPNIQVYRAHFSALTRADIMQAMNTLRIPDKNLSDAVNARQEIDLRIGASFTRFQTLTLRKSYSLSGVISYGPCQFPTLGFVVQRHRDIECFIAEKFWYLVYKYKWTDQQGQQRVNEFSWERGKLFSEFDCLLFYEICLLGDDINHPSINGQIKDVHRKQTSKWKPVPLSTIEFEKLATHKLRISAKQAMEVAEKLYNQGYISYPRTETNSFSSTIDLKAFINFQRGSNLWGNFACNLLDYGGFEQPRSGNKDDKAHPPIHPVKLMSRQEASSDLEFQIYEMITRHFLACCSRNATGSETNISLQINSENFNLKGLQIQQLNYLEVYTYEKWSENVVPNLEVGANLSIKPEEITFETGQTSPPVQLTETELIGLMDKNGIGTDATIHEHISTIQDRGYAKKTGQIFRPTKLGIALVETYNQLGFGLHLPQLRATMEARMNQVASGAKQKEEMIKQTIDEMELILRELQEKRNNFVSSVGQYLDQLQNYTVDEEGNEVPVRQLEMGLCGICQQQMKYQEMGDGERFMLCENCSKKYKLPRDGQISYKPEVCPICQFQILEVKKEDGRTYLICPFCYTSPPDGTFEERMPCFKCKHETCKFSPLTRNQEGPFNCNICQSTLVIKTTKRLISFLGCSAFPRCKTSLFLPSFIKKIKVSTQKCTKCQSLLTNLEFNDDELMFGNLLQRVQNKSTLWCLYPACDQDLGIQIKWTQQQNQSQISQQSTNNQQTTQRHFNLNYEENKTPNQNNWSHQTSQPLQENQQPKQIICYKCKEPGHLSNNCHNQKSNTDQDRSLLQEKPKQVICYKCQEPGHFSNNCPNQNANSNQSHQSFQQNNQSTQGQKIVCFKCQDPAHLANNCPAQNTSNKQNQQPAGFQNQQSNSIKQVTCYKCQEIGHFANNCTNQQFNVNMNESHQLQNNENSILGIANQRIGYDQQQQQFKPPGSQQECFKCKLTGHWANKCPNNSSNNNFNNNNNQPQEKFQQQQKQTQQQQQQLQNQTQQAINKPQHPQQQQQQLQNITCYRCQTPGHLSTNCPQTQQLQKKANKKVAQQNQKNECQFCGVLRHPKNSACDGVKQKKKKNSN